MEEFHNTLLVRLSQEPILREIYSTNRLHKDRWAEKQVVRAELDIVVDAVLKLYGTEPCLIGTGDDKSCTGFNLASKYENFQQKRYHSAMYNGNHAFLSYGFWGSLH
jgi:hypothetical protein